MGKASKYFRIIQVWLVTMSFRRIKRFLLKIIIFIFAIFLGLAIGEVVIRIGDFDYHFIEKLMYYQGADLSVYTEDPNPRLLYRLKPNSAIRKIEINSIGERGPERKISKKPNLFRIICVGGSNTFGAGLWNRETWPAQLEALLNLEVKGEKGFEVWNMGASGYAPSQMVELSIEIINKYNPDILMFSVSNTGWRPFLKGTNIKRYFQKDPELWPYYFSDLFFEPINKLSYENQIRFIKNSRLYRLIIIYYLVHIPEVRPVGGPSHTMDNIAVTRSFIKNFSHKTRLVFFICPAVKDEHFKPFVDGLDIEVFELKAKGMDPEYSEIHPPAKVMKWYARKIAAWLLENNLLPISD